MNCTIRTALNFHNDKPLKTALINQFKSFNPSTASTNSVTPFTVGRLAIEPLYNKGGTFSFSKSAKLAYYTWSHSLYDEGKFNCY